jgi:CubicO group peptidase (beta-lactamase class C family)
MNITDLDDVVARFVDDTSQRWAHSGAQLVVTVDGSTVADVATGVGHRDQPFRSDTISALYCTAKPLVAVAVLEQVALGELSLDDRVGDVVDSYDGWIAQRRIDEVLSHTAGLHVLDEITPRILPESLRGPVVASLSPPQGWRFGVDGSYAPFAGWWLLGQVLEELTGQTFQQVVADMLARYGVDPTTLTAGFDLTSWEAARPRLSATYDFTRDPAIPLLAEVGPQTACEWNPAYGGYGTAGGLAAFYEALRRDLDGAEVVVPAELLRTATTPRSATEDVKLGRMASFGLGFMCDLEGHHFGARVAASSFGHSGQGGTSWAFCDPDARLVVAAVFNGAADEDTALRYRRAVLVTSIYQALQL